MQRTRLIGDFLDINADINAEYNRESKIPKFIRKIKYKKYKKILVKEINDLRNSSISLNTDMIIEFFSYIISDKGNYGCIKKCKLKDESYLASITGDNIVAYITIYMDSYPEFTIDARYKDGKGATYGLSIQCSELYSSVSMNREILGEVNRLLLNVICNYILSNVNLDEKEGINNEIISVESRETSIRSEEEVGRDNTRDAS